MDTPEGFPPVENSQPAPAAEAIQEKPKCIPMPEYPPVPRRDHFESILKRLQGKRTKKGVYQGFRAALMKHRRSGLSPGEAYKLASAPFWHKAIDLYRETHPLAETIRLDDLPMCPRSDESIQKALATDNRRKWVRLHKWVKKCAPSGAPWPSVVEWVANHVGMDARAIDPESVPDVRCVMLLKRATDDDKWFWDLKNKVEQKPKDVTSDEESEKGLRRADERATADLIRDFKRALKAVGRG